MVIEHIKSSKKWKYYIFSIISYSEP